MSVVTTTSVSFISVTMTCMIIMFGIFAMIIVSVIIISVSTVIMA